MTQHQNAQSSTSLQFTLACIPTTWSASGEVAEERLEFSRTPARPGTTPTAVCYGPLESEFWDTLYRRNRTGLRNKPGIYEVRYRPKSNAPYKWLHIGNAGGKLDGEQGLAGRINNLLRHEEKHSHRKDILEYMAVEGGLTGTRDQQRDEQAWQPLEVRWAYCDKEDTWLLEYLLHLRYEPVFPDKDIFGDTHFFPFGRYLYFWYRG